MYVFVEVNEKKNYYANGPGCGRVKARLEEASGERCLIIPYQEFNLAVVQQLRPRAIAMSGFGGHWQDRKVEGFWGMDQVLHEADLPIIGFCGSHQLIGFSFTRNLHQTTVLCDEPMRKLDENDPLPRRANSDIGEYFLAQGFYPITRIRDDPLFEGLQARMLMCCSHYCEVKELPPEFELLATSDHCRIEAMRHRTRPLYGTQFHPEAYESPYFDGKTLLRNFAGIVEQFWAARQHDA